VVLPEPVALDLADDYDLIAGLTTWGEARAANPKQVWVPGLSEDEDDPHADSDPYDPTATGVYEDGDWPLHPGTYALDELPEELHDIGGVGESMVTAPFLYIDPADEADLVRELRSRGYDARRDDQLFARLDPYFP
jgi:hypothetical protein